MLTVGNPVACDKRWDRQGRWVPSFCTSGLQFIIMTVQLCWDLKLWLFLFLENVFFPCNIISYKNVIEDDNLIGTLSEIEKHCETTPGIVSEENIHVTNVLKYFTYFFRFPAMYGVSAVKNNPKINYLNFVLIMFSMSPYEIRSLVIKIHTDLAFSSILPKR